VNCIHPDPYEVPADALEAAKDAARAHAAKTRRQKQEREALVARTLAKLAGSASHA
jgi:hypothetical protein